MNFTLPYLLSIITFLPLVGAFLVLVVPGDRAKKILALLTTLLTFVVSLLLLTNWQNVAGMQFVERVPWFPPLDINYALGVDGISLFLVLLTTLLMPIAIYFSNLYVSKRIGAYMALMLLLETAMIGVFLSLDLVLFFVFFEASLIPMYFLIGEWGGQNRIYAAVKFFIYTFAGSALMVVAILIVYFSTGTFDIVALQSANIAPAVQTWAFIAFALAFAVKTPLFPFHTWLPDAHVQAPTAGSIILAGVLLKMGTYGYLRLAMPIFPQAAVQFGPFVGALAVIGIIYGALVALTQQDIKSLVAYSSVAHLGYVMLGLVAFNAIGIGGSVLQMVNHGLSTGALFLMVGYLYERRHTRNLDEFGGLWKSIPVFCGLLPGRRDEQRRHAGPQRLCRRVHDHAGRLPGHALVRRHCGRGRHPGRVVPADRLPQDGAGADHKARERQSPTQRPALRRSAAHAAAGLPVLYHRPFPQPLLRQDQPFGRGAGDTAAGAHRSSRAPSSIHPISLLSRHCGQ